MPPWLPSSVPASTGAALRCAQTPAGPAPNPRKPLGDIAHDQHDEHAENDTEANAADEDSDLELTGFDEDDERVGLDTSTGFDDVDDLELSDDGEGERWSNDSEEVGDLPGTDTDLFQGEEYGWIGDDEPSDDDDEAFDADLSDEDGAPSEDGGAEGLEDDSELDDLDMSELPEMDADAEEDAAGNGAEVFEELSTPGMVDECNLEVAAGQTWKALPPRSVHVSHLSTLPEPPLALAACSGHVLVCAGRLLAFDAERAVSQALPLSAAGPSALALTDQDGDLHIAVVVAGSVFVSEDGGHRFVQQGLSEPAKQVGFTRASQAPRLWWLSESGVLHSSALAEPLDAEVLGFHTDGVRHVIALVRRQERLWLACSQDAGRLFTFYAVPLGVQAGTSLDVCRNGWLLHDRSRVQCAASPQSFELVSSLAIAPATLSDEEGEAFVYACVRRGEELLIVRRAVHSSIAAPLVMVALGADVASQVRQLAVSYAEGGFVSIYVATDGSLLRVDASLDGEELA